MDDAATIADERLELIFTCCHPALALEAQVALALRTLGGLSTDEIALAFLVSLILFRYRAGRLGDIPPEHVHEVAETRWLPLEDAPELLAYKGEREMAAKALERLSR